MSNEATKTVKNTERNFFRVSAADFKKIPGNPIAYWLPQSGLIAFSYPELNKMGQTRRGLQTGNKDRYIRNWFEVCSANIEWAATHKHEAAKSSAKWFKFNNGGDFRKWYGNLFLVVNWANDGKNIKDSGGAIIPSESLYFDSAACWARLSSGNNAFRVHPIGVIPGDLSPCYYSDHDEYAIAFLNSSSANYFLNVINPTITKTVGDIGKIPSLSPDRIEGAIKSNSTKLIESHKADWISDELSWDFVCLPLLKPGYGQPAGWVSDNVTRQLEAASYPLPLSIKETYTQLRTHWQEMTLEMQRLEQENNRIFINAYGLQDELTPEVPLKEITLTCNPHYRYGNNKNEEELETLLLADTMKEFVSYAVGCMFGRYALEKPGLILANQGETIEDYLKQIPEPSFLADDDNVIPMLDGDWFTDDITERFCKFLKVTFGDDHYEANLTSIEKALGKDIRKYLLKDFYNDHVRRYKKRPIYWLFSSPKGTFNALIYMHRYRPDTVSVVLNDYLREFRTKLSAHKNHLEAVSISSSASAGEKTKALKDIESHRKMIDELDSYEREVMYPLATEQKEINLDDGVKVNYQKFGEALKKIPGLAAKDEE